MSIYLSTVVQQSPGIVDDSDSEDDGLDPITDPVNLRYYYASSNSSILPERTVYLGSETQLNELLERIGNYNFFERATRKLKRGSNGKPVAILSITVQATPVPKSFAC